MEYIQISLFGKTFPEHSQATGVWTLEPCLKKSQKPKFQCLQSGRWANAGVVRGGIADVAWRVLDAQYWGVPQRRKRIYLVADYRGQRAGEVLFKPEGMSRYPAPCGEAWESIAADIERSFGETGGRIIGIPTIYDARGNGDGKTSPTITGDHNNRITDYTAVLCEPIAFQGQASESAELSISDKVAPTIQCTKNVDIVLPIYAIDYAAFNQGINAQYGISINDNGILQTLVAKGPGAVGVPIDNLTYMVRRLTPSECAKVQGFSADWHKGIVNAKGKEMPDTATYRGYGNAVATVCAEYPIQGIYEILSKEERK